MKITQAKLKATISRSDRWTCDGERHETGTVAGLFYDVTSYGNSEHIATVYGAGADHTDSRKTKDHAIAATAQGLIEMYGDNLELIL